MASSNSLEPPTKKPKMTIVSFSLPIKVLVGSGPNKTEFYLSKDLLCSESTFFKSACNEAWESGRTNTVTLEDGDPKLFVTFATWIATGSVEACSGYIEFEDEIKKNMEEYDDDDSGWEVMKLWHYLCRVYILGDFLGSRNFRNSTMKILIEKAGILVEAEGDITCHDQIVSLIYGNTNPGSPLRHLLLCLALQSIDLDILSQSVITWTLEPLFYTDLLTLALDQGRRG